MAIEIELCAHGKKSIFEVQVTKQAIAISTDGVGQWKFLVFEENQRALLEKLVRLRKAVI